MSRTPTSPSCEAARDCVSHHVHHPRNWAEHRHTECAAAGSGCCRLLLNAASPSAANNASLVNSLRRHLLTDLDLKVFQHPDGGLVTKVQFRIFKVMRDVSSGALVLKVWRRVRWFDERLAWDPEKFGGLGTVLVYPNRADQTSLDDNMWLPHIVVYNALKAETAMFETGAAWVRSDGRVHWSVPGTIEITCRFSGRTQQLARVP